MNTKDQRETFDALIQQHESLRSPKLRLLLELRDSIAEARKKGASYEAIQSYLSKTAIIVSADTVARFCRHILSEPSGRKAKRSKPRQARTNTHDAADLIKQKRSGSSSSVRYQPPTGPRIVNPKDL